MLNFPLIRRLLAQCHTSIIDGALVPVTDVSTYEILNVMKDLIMSGMSEKRGRANDRRNR